MIDNPRSGRSSTNQTTENMPRVRGLFNSSRRRSVKIIVYKLILPITIVHTIMTKNVNHAENVRQIGHQSVDGWHQT